MRHDSSGRRWGRKDDTATVALAVEQLSTDGKRQQVSGGQGVLQGDARLPRPRAGAVVEDS